MEYETSDFDRQFIINLSNEGGAKYDMQRIALYFQETQTFILCTNNWEYFKDLQIFRYLSCPENHKLKFLREIEEKTIYLRAHYNFCPDIIVGHSNDITI